MIERMDLPATVLRPSCFFQNDVTQNDPLAKAGLSVSPVGDKDVSMLDVRDIADAAVIDLRRGDRAPATLPRATYELSGRDVHYGAAISLRSRTPSRPRRRLGPRTTCVP